MYEFCIPATILWYNNTRDINIQSENLGFQSGNIGAQCCENTDFLRENPGVLVQKHWRSSKGNDIAIKSMQFWAPIEVFEALTIDENFPILAHQYGNACEAVWNHGYSSVKNLILKCGIQDILYENPNGAVRKPCW